MCLRLFPGCTALRWAVWSRRTRDKTEENQKGGRHRGAVAVAFRHLALAPASGMVWWLPVEPCIRRGAWRGVGVKGLISVSRDLFGGLSLPLGILNYHQAISFPSGLRCGGYVLLAGCQAALTTPEVSSGQWWSDLSLEPRLCLVFGGWIFSTAMQRVTVSPFSKIRCPTLPGLASTYVWRKLTTAWIQTLAYGVYERKWEMLLIIFLPELRNNSSPPLAVMGKEEDRSYLS